VGNSDVLRLQNPSGVLRGWDRPPGEELGQVGRGAPFPSRAEWERVDSGWALVRGHGKKDPEPPSPAGTSHPSAPAGCQTLG
jgi:hypothetical protein